MQVTAKLENNFLFEFIVSPDPQAIEYFPAQKEQSYEDDSLNQIIVRSQSGGEYPIKNTLDDGGNQDCQKRHATGETKGHSEQKLVLEQIDPYPTYHIIALISFHDDSANP